MRGTKNIEYRTWDTKHRGDLLICSSANPQVPGMMSGCALCVVELVDTQYDSANDVYEWHLSNVRKIKAFPVKGKLNFFEVDEWRTFDINNSLRIRFAAIAKDSDLLLYYYRSGLHNYLRIDTVANLCCVNSLAQRGRMQTESRVDGIIACEILAPDSAVKIRSLIDVKSDNPGMDVKEHSSLLYAVEAAIGYALPVM